MRQFVVALIVTCSAGFFAAPAKAQTIVDAVLAASGNSGFDTNNQDYDMLRDALVAANLVAPLADPNGVFTVWAPNDAAFILLAQDLGYVGSDESGAFSFIVGQLSVIGGGDPIPVLSLILLYHVAPERIPVWQFFFRSFFNIPVLTLSGETFQPAFTQVIDNDPDLADASLTFPLNGRLSNGILHTVTRVLIPVDL